MLYIREATPSDAIGLTNLSRRAKAALGYPAEWLKAWEPQLTFTVDYLQTTSVFVAELKGQIAGVIALVELLQPEIDHLWVDPTVQSQGVGSRLLDEAFSVAKTKGWSALRVVADPYAVPFYEKKGFRVVGLQDAPVLGHSRQLPVLERAV